MTLSIRSLSAALIVAGVSASIDVSTIVASEV